MSATQTLDIEEPPRAVEVEVAPDGGYGWTVVAASSTLLFWINGYTTTWGVLQTAIVTSPSSPANVQTITFVGSLYMACMVAFGLPSVRLLAVLGVRYACLASVALFGVGLICTSFTLRHLSALFCLNGVMVGLGASVLYTTTNILPSQWFSGKLGLANGLVKTGGGVGATVLPVAVQALIDHYGLPWAFRALGLGILAMGIPCALLLRDRVGATQISRRLEWSSLKSIPFLTVTIAGAIGVFALFVPAFFLPLFASSIGIPASTGAGLVAGYGASTAIGRLLGGWGCDRIGAFNSLALAALINSVSMLAIWPVSSTLAPLLIFAVVNGCANGGFFVALPTAVAALHPTSAASSISMMTSFWTPGYLLGAPLAGILIEATRAEAATSIGPYRAAIFYSAGTALLATILIGLSRLRQEKKLLKRI